MAGGANAGQYAQLLAMLKASGGAAGRSEAGAGASALGKNNFGALKGMGRGGMSALPLMMMLRGGGGMMNNPLMMMMMMNQNGGALKQMCNFRSLTNIAVMARMPDGMRDMCRTVMMSNMLTGKGGTNPMNLLFMQSMDLL